MTNVSTTLNFLFVGPEFGDDLHRARYENEITSNLRTLHEAGQGLDAVILLGTNSVARRDGYSGVDRIIESVLTESMEQGPGNELPLVLPVPGLGDLTPVAPGRMLANALTHWWGATGPGIPLSHQEDVIEGLRNDVFAEFETWASSTRNGLTGWHPGLLPGEGSIQLKKADLAVGLVVANSVFRMVLPDPSPDLATCSAEQISAAVGGEWSQWTRQNGLSMVFAGHSATWPDALGLGSSTVLVAADDSQPAPSIGSSWITFPRDQERRYRLLKVDLGNVENPLLTDLAATRSEQPISLVRPRNTQPRQSALQSESAIYNEGERVVDFYKQIATGQMVLVLMSGIEGEMGFNTVDELNQQLAKTVFGEVPIPPPTMSETWSAALARLQPHSIERELRALRSSQAAVSPAAHRILNAPWWRIYDFTASDALQTVASKNSKLAGAVAVINACHEKPGSKNNLVEVVAMNGTASDTLTSVDFSHPDSDATDARALWFKRFKAEMLCHPVAFMASSPSNAELWQTLTLVGPQGEGEGFPRFIITPTGSTAGQVRLSQSGLTHIRQNPAEFSTITLRAGDQSLAQGKKRQSENLSSTRRGAGISALKSLLDNAPRGSDEFLKGSDPKWGDIVDGFSAKLSIVDTIRTRSEPGIDDRFPIVLVEGRAGCGKTTALMSYAYDLHRQGNTVGWIDREATNPLAEIRVQASEMDLDAVFVDDVDMFGGQAAKLLRELGNGGRTLVVAAIRTTRSEVVDATFRPERVDADRPMTDEDLKSLIKVLRKNGLLGILKQYRFSPAARIDKLREICERSLLAAMIEVVSGKPFEAKVRGEFHELKMEQRAIYATVCVFESTIVFKKRGIEEADLLQIVSPQEPSRKMKTNIDHLISMRLLDRAQDGTLRCRQRTIADTVVETVLKDDPKQLGSVIELLLKFYAGYAGHILDSDNPYRRIMIRLLNHSLMVSLHLPREMVRNIYSAIHDLLQDDFHYWLQRGEYEFEMGDIDVAANYLESARGSGGIGDYLVQTAWGAVTLRRSSNRPQDDTLLQQALGAITELERVIRMRGNASPHTFTVMTRSGTEWLTACQNVLSASEGTQIAMRILDVVELGRKICKDNHQVLSTADIYEPKLRRIIRHDFGIPT
jgi:hypothetical protein